MTSRFDNLPTDELLRLEMQSRIDRDELMTLIGERFRSDGPYQIGRVYRVKPGFRLAGRKMLLSYIVVGTPTIPRWERLAWPIASGPLDKGKGWNTKHERIGLEALDPEALDD